MKEFNSSSYTSIIHHSVSRIALHVPCNHHFIGRVAAIALFTAAAFLIGKKAGCFLFGLSKSGQDMPSSFWNFLRSTNSSAACRCQYKVLSMGVVGLTLFGLPTSTSLLVRVCVSNGVVIAVYIESGGESQVYLSLLEQS
jgi:hypothetical protein